MATLDAFLAALLQFSAQSAPWLVLGYVVAGIMREYVPTALVARWFKGGGIGAHLRAAGTGALLPMCSCTVLPMSVSLVRAGAAKGSVLAFLLTAPAISPVAVLLAVSLLGPLFAPAAACPPSCPESSAPPIPMPPWRRYRPGIGPSWRCWR